METSVVDPSKRRSQFLALGLAIFAFMSMGKFPGASGWLGGAGWLLFAATVLAAPSLAAFEPRLPERDRGLAIFSLAVSLIIIVSCVVVWAGAR